MTLLGRPLEILLVLLTLGFPAAALWFWRRVRGPRAARIAQRAGLLVGAQLAAVLTTAVGLNHIGYFYGSWSDLFRGQLTGVKITAVSTNGGHSGRTDVSPASAGRLSVKPTRRLPGSTRLWARRGRWEAVDLRGAASGLAVRTEVYLPPKYFRPAYRHTRFAGVEVLAGPPRKSPPASYLSSVRHLVDTHQSHPTVVIVVHPAPTSPREAMCGDLPTGPQRETLFARDVPIQIAHAYRVQPTGWGIAGQGSGGYCAVKLAMLHPRVFSAAASLDGYFSPPVRRGSTDPWSGSQVLRDLSDLNWRLLHMPAPPISVLLTSTKASTGAADSAFAKRVGPPMTVRTSAEAPGTARGLATSTSWLTGQLHPGRLQP